MAGLRTLIAAPWSLKQVVDALLYLWNEYQVIASAELKDWDAVCAWQPQVEQRFSSLVLWEKEEEWTVVAEDGYGLGLENDLDRMAQLSGLLETVAVSVTCTTAGYSSFRYYEHGSLLRGITHSEGITTTEGEPLSQETGIDQVIRYEGDRVEAVWDRVVGPFWANQFTPPFLVLALTDPNWPPPLPPPPPPRPWWKFWG